jgi:hypothetical protein
MIIKTEGIDRNGRQKTEIERVRHIPEAKLDRYREVARTSAQFGETRTIRVVKES